MPLWPIALKMESRPARDDLDDVHLAIPMRNAVQTPPTTCITLTERSHQRNCLGGAHHHRAGNLVMPGLALAIEADPDEAEPGKDQRQETAQGPHDHGGPVELAPIDTHHVQVTERAADGGSLELPHQSPVA